MPGFFIYNSELFTHGENIVGPQNRSLRYGDGLFETIRYHQAEIPLAQLHFERLFAGLATLKFELPSSFTPSFLEEQIHVLCTKNDVEDSARIRLNVFRGNGGPFEPESLQPNYVIECTELDQRSTGYNQNGLSADIFKAEKKSMSALSNLKSNNYLIYLMAALNAREQKLDEIFVLNNENRIADSCIANVFWIKNQTIYTPPLSEGGVAGVMRKYLLQRLPALNFSVEEKMTSESDLLNADEIFLTNAISGIRWVRKFQTAQYANLISSELYKKIIQPLFPAQPIS